MRSGLGGGVACSCSGTRMLSPCGEHWASCQHPPLEQGSSSSNLPAPSCVLEVQAPGPRSQHTTSVSGMGDKLPQDYCAPSAWRSDGQQAQNPARKSRGAGTGGAGRREKPAGCCSALGPGSRPPVSLTCLLPQELHPAPPPVPPPLSTPPPKQPCSKGSWELEGEPNKAITSLSEHRLWESAWQLHQPIHFIYFIS